MSQILEKLRKDMFQAVKDHDPMISGIIQLAMASAKNTQITKGEELTEEEMIDVLRKEAKKLQDSLEQFTAAGREDLASTTKTQLEYIEGYLPKMMSEQEIETIVVKVIEELSANGPQDMGKVMGKVMSQLQGKAEGALVKDVVTKKLS